MSYSPSWQPQLSLWGRGPRRHSQQEEEEERQVGYQQSVWPSPSPSLPLWAMSGPKQLWCADPQLAS